MAYTFAIEPLVPDNSDLVSLGAGVIRDFKEAMIERLESVFVDLDADPLVFKTGVTFQGVTNFGTIIGTSASATALVTGLNGSTNPSFVVDSSVALQAAGLKVTAAVAAGTVALSVVSSGAAANLSVNAKGTGTILVGNVSTGQVSVTPATAFEATISVTDFIAANGGIQVAATEFVYFGAGSDTGIAEASANVLSFYAGGVNGLDLTTTLVDVLVDLDVAGDLGVTGDITIASTKFLYLGLGSNTGLWEASVGTVQIVVEGAGILTLSNTNATVTGGFTTTGRMVGNEDIASAVAFGVFSNNEYDSTTDVAITAVFGVAVSYGNAVSSGTQINLKTQLNQTVATSGTVYASHNTVVATLSSGAVAAAVGHQSSVHASVSGGTITTAVALQAQVLAAAGATITSAIGVQVQAPVATGTITNRIGVLIQSQGDVAIRVGTNAGAADDSIFNFTGANIATNATKGFVFISACAGTPNGTPDNNGTGRIPMVYDVTNNRIYFNNGGVWRSAVVS